MLTETIEDEISANGSRKIVLGVRCFPELKNKLSQEAADLGITLSEHTENILLNTEGLLYEKENAEKEAEAFKEINSRLNAMIRNERSQFKAEKIKIENDELKRKEIIMNDQVALFTHKHLLDLFQQLKGKKDTIETPDGQKFSVTYDDPKDLLEVMIISYKYDN